MAVAVRVIPVTRFWPMTTGSMAVAWLSSRNPSIYNAKGCAACHGPKADGVLAVLPTGDIITVGAANLADGIWRFEPGGFESAKHTILYGVNQTGVEGTRDAVMPAFLESGKLDEQSIKKLVVYVHELGGGQ